MYLPRSLISLLYKNLQKTHGPASPHVLILSSLETDSICACRILTALFKRDYIQHRIEPVAGYADLQRYGETLVRPLKINEGGSGGVVICLGVGGLCDLSHVLGLNDEGNAEDEPHGVEVWVFDARRPWNLHNVFGSYEHLLEREGDDQGQLRRTQGIEKGRVQGSYRPGKGGIIVFDDGDIVEELQSEQESWFALAGMAGIEDDDDSDQDSDQDDPPRDDFSDSSSQSRKRKSWSDRDASDDEAEERPSQRRRSNSGSSIASPRSPPQSPSQNRSITRRDRSTKQLRQKLRRLRETHSRVIDDYWNLGISYSEPISSLAYSLASELGRDDNDLLWLTIVGVTSLELSGHTSTGLGTPHSKPEIRSRQYHQRWRMDRSMRTYTVLRDEVRRFNPPSKERQSLLTSRPQVTSASDSSIQLVPDPRFMLLRHWSLYDSMLHSTYLAARLHVWNESGTKRLHKLLAKMGISLNQCKQGYMHMDVAVRASLRERLLKYSNMYGLDELVPTGEGQQTYEQEGWGFLRTWGWKAQLSAVDVGIIVGAILEVVQPAAVTSTEGSTQQSDAPDLESKTEPLVKKFWLAYDALAPQNPTKLLQSVPKAQQLMRSILRAGSGLLAKHQIRHLRAFRMGVVKDGPDLALFANSPGALVRLALWVGEAVAVSERDKKGTNSATPLVLAALDEPRSIYVVVGIGGGIGGAEDQEAKKEKEEKKAKKKAEKEQKKKIREEKRAARRLVQELNNDSDIEEDESEEEEDDDDDSSDEEEDEEQVKQKQKRGYGRNRFGLAFHEVVEQTQAALKIDSFDHCVVEVRKEDLAAFLEGLSSKMVVGR